MGVPGRFIFPSGFIDLAAHGRPGRAWWPSDGSAREQAMRDGAARDLSDFEPPGLGFARDELNALLDALSAEAGPSPLILGGFSQGAMLAFDLALNSRRALSAVVQLSGARIAQRRWNPLLVRRAGTRAFISHGRSDPDLAFSAATRFGADLRTAGWGLEFCAFDGGHEVPLVALRALKRFLLSL